MTILFCKVNYGIMLESKISWKVLMVFYLEFFYGKVKFAFWTFIWEEFMDFAEGFDAKVNKYSSTDVHKNRFVH